MKTARSIKEISELARVFGMDDPQLARMLNNIARATSEYLRNAHPHFIVDGYEADIWVFHQTLRGPIHLLESLTELQGLKNQFGQYQFDMIEEVFTPPHHEVADRAFLCVYVGKNGNFTCYIPAAVAELDNLFKIAYKEIQNAG